MVGTPWTEATTEPAAAATARRPPWAAAAAAIAAAALVAGAFGWSRSHAAASIHSLAVLPLTNLTNDPDQEYFADGMTDALITDLASIRALRVISRQSVMRYKGSRKPLPEIARELDVDAVVEGSVARSGLRVAEVPVSYRRRVGVSKITGTVSGTLRAGYKILWTVARYGVIR